MDLALAYFNGRGVPQDQVLAYMWVNLAAARSSDPTFKESFREVRDLFATELTRGELSEAQRLGREWEAANSTPNEDPTLPGTTGGTGTAFIVDPAGLLLTAYHVIDQATSISVSCNAQPPVPAHVTSSSATTDLALLEVSGDLGTELFLRLSPRRSSLGDRVFTIGYPTPFLLGTDPKYTDGTVSALSGPGGDASFLQISVPVQPGNSGGPLVNDEGDVVGVVVASADAPAFFQATGDLPQNINWAVKSVYVSALFEPPSAGAAPAAEADDIIERVTEATCLVRTTVPLQ